MRREGGGWRKGKGEAGSAEGREMKVRRDEEGEERRRGKMRGESEEKK